jgi:Flp pilus assembly pilin Flp
MDVRSTIGRPADHDTTRRQRRLDDDAGLSTVEYVLVLALIAAASIGGWQLLGRRVICLARQADGTFATLGSDRSATTDCDESSPEEVAPVDPAAQPRVKRKIREPQSP